MNIIITRKIIIVIVIMSGMSSIGPICLLLNMEINILIQNLSIFAFNICSRIINLLPLNQHHITIAAKQPILFLIIQYYHFLFYLHIIIFIIIIIIKLNSMECA